MIFTFWGKQEQGEVEADSLAEAKAKFKAEKEKIVNVWADWAAYTESLVWGSGDIMLTHPDTVSGTTVFADGIKVYWTEGYSQAVVKYPDGRSEQVDAQNETHPVMVRERAFELTKHACREMNHGELNEWEVARGCEGEWSEAAESDDFVEGQECE